MNLNQEKYDLIIQKIEKWAIPRSDIKLAMIVGSRARIDKPADQWSDLDVTLITTKPDRYFKDAEWLQEVGTLLVKYDFTNQKGDREWRVIFHDGTVVDFSIIKYDFFSKLYLMVVRLFDKYPILGTVFPKTKASIEDEKRYDSILFNRGVRILFDKSGNTAKWMKLLGDPKWQPPNQSEYLAYIDGFWFLLYYAAGMIRRGEYFFADHVCADIRTDMITLIEWHAKALNGQDYDTWHGGRFLEEWADPKVTNGFKQITISHSQKAFCRSVYQTINLFKILAQETAERLQLQYPLDLEKKIMTLIENIIPESIISAD